MIARISRLAVVLLLCTAAVSATAPPSDEQIRLHREMHQAIAARDWSAAVSAGERLIDIDAGDATAAYNLACACARSGQGDEAVRWLRTAGQNGFYLMATMLRDTDLDSIHDHPGFPEAVAAVQRSSAAELEKFKKTHSDRTVMTVLPPGLDDSRPAPLIVALHGRGGTASSMVSAWRDVAADTGAILIAPQAVKPAGTGFEWGVVEQGEWLVLDAIERTRSTHQVDEGKIVLTGFSQGGAMTYLIGLRHPEKFAGLIPMAGYYDHRVVRIPDTPANAADSSAAGSRLPRFYIMYGELDEDVENNREAARRLKALGAPHVLKIYPGVGHTFPPNKDAELREALRFVLGR